MAKEEKTAIPFFLLNFLKNCAYTGKNTGLIHATGSFPTEEQKVILQKLLQDLHLI